MRKTKTKATLIGMTLALAVVASFVAASAPAQTINVNFYNTTGTLTLAVESTLHGVLGANGGLGTTWNQFNIDWQQPPLEP